MRPRTFSDEFFRCIVEFPFGRFVFGMREAVRVNAAISESCTIERTVFFIINAGSVKPTLF